MLSCQFSFVIPSINSCNANFEINRKQVIKICACMGTHLHVLPFLAQLDESRKSCCTTPGVGGGVSKMLNFLH